MKWGATKKARQQISRMKGSYTRKDGTKVTYQIHNDAIDTFLNAQKVIQESGMSRKDKSAAIERAAQQFLNTGMGTRRGIMSEFDSFVGNLPEQDTITLPTGETIDLNMQEYVRDMIGKDWKKAAEYMDASTEQKHMMEARHYAGSDVIQQLADMQKTGTISLSSMYSMMGDVAAIVASRGEIAPDELQGIIMDLMEDYSQ